MQAAPTVSIKKFQLSEDCTKDTSKRVLTKKHVPVQFHFGGQADVSHQILYEQMLPIPWIKEAKSCNKPSDILYKDLLFMNKSTYIYTH